MHAPEAEPIHRRDLLIPALFAAAKIALHLPFVSNYGIFRDELYYLDCADRLDWGYVDHPPLSILVLWAFRALLGDSLWAIRLPAILAGAACVFLAGVLARMMCGGRFAQSLASLCMLAAPVYLAVCTFFSMNPIDQMFWTIAAVILLRIVQTGDGRLWIAFGLVAGLGLQNKISVLFLGLGLLAALALTPHRKHFRDWRLYAGGALAGLIFLPHILWQIPNGWPTLEFTRNAALYKNAPVGPVGFLLSQLLLMHPLAAPVWIAGLAYGLVHREGRAYRVFPMLFLTVFLFLALTYGKDYYLAPAYPPIVALGAIAVERASDSRRWLRPAAAGVLAAGGIALVPLGVPVLPIESFIRYQQAIGLSRAESEVGAESEIPQYFSDRFGWEEMAETVARTYHALDPSDRGKCVIFTGNYGQAGAINQLGRRHGLPRALSGHNNHYLWGYGDAAGDLFLVIGVSMKEIEAARDWFEDVREVARHTHPHARPSERNLPIYLCRGLKKSMAEFWAEVKTYI